MRKSESIAAKIMLSLQEKHGYAFDPFTIIMIAGIIINVIKLIYECRNSKEDRMGMLRGPTLVEKIVLRRAINKECSGKDIKPKDLYASLIGWKLSTSEIEALFKEVEENGENTSVVG